MIARDLGRTHTELLTSCSAKELAWWKALYGVENDERRDAQREAESQRAANSRGR